jgi:hypothetical protein
LLDGSQVTKVDPNEPHRHGAAVEDDDANDRRTRAVATAAFISTSPGQGPNNSQQGSSIRYAQLTTSGSIVHSPVPPDVTNIRDAKLAIAQGRTGGGGGVTPPAHRQGQQQEEVEPSMLMEDLQRSRGPEKASGSDLTATTARSSTSSWSQLPVAKPIDVSANESSMSLLPNSGVMPIRASQIGRGEVSSIRDDLILRASARSSSNTTTTSGFVKNSVTQFTDTSTTISESSSSGVTPSMIQTMPRRQMLETTDELEVDDDGEQEGGASYGGSSPKQHVKQKEDPPARGPSCSKLAVVAVVVVVLVVAAVACVCLVGHQCGGGTNDGTDNNGEDNIDADEDRSTRITKFINSITLSTAPLEYPVTIDSRLATNPERALAWLLDDDPLQLQGFDNELLRVRQRFVLLLIWFGTANNMWKQTDAWLSGAHECDWANVVCTDAASGERIIRELKLGNGDIVGMIPDDLALLSDNLQHLVLAYNRWTGTIPSSLGLLTKLTYFDAQSNSLSGTIPSSLSSLSLLQVFYVGINKLVGTIPLELGRWTSATVLSLFDNQISGQIPSELGNMSMLKAFNIHDTMIGGSFPESLVALVNATEILVYNTNLNGTMPLCDQGGLDVFQLVADCGKVNCTCCTACCPGAFGAIPVYYDC